MSKKLGFPVLVAAAALAMLPLLPATLTAEAEPHPTEIIPAKVTNCAKTTEPPPKANKMTKEPAVA
jgi:hypothetical protein